MQLAKPEPILSILGAAVSTSILRRSCLMVMLVTCTVTSASDYVFSSGDKTWCDSYRKQAERILYVKPTLARGDPGWKQMADRCPSMVRKPKWMPYPDREFDDLSLYKIDINNDGQIDDVLYRRYDKPHFVTYVKDGVERRREAGIEVTQEFFLVDLASCKLDKIFGGFAETRLFQFDDVTYIENINIHDRNKTKRIYKRETGKLTKQKEQLLCVFRLTN